MGNVICVHFSQRADHYGVVVNYQCNLAYAFKYGMRY